MAVRTMATCAHWWLLEPADGAVPEAAWRQDAANSFHAAVTAAELPRGAWAWCKRCLEERFFSGGVPEMGWKAIQSHARRRG